MVKINCPLPKGWEWKTIGDVTEPIEKVNPREKPKEQFTYLDIASIDNTVHRITEPKTYYGVEAPSRARQLVRANDVLFSTVRTYLENIAFVPDVYDEQIASTGFSVLRASKEVLPKLLFYYSLTNAFLAPLNELQRGTSYPAVRDSDVRTQPIPLAPMPEQERIVRRIEELFSQLEAGVTALKRVQEALKRYKASVLKAACDGKFSESRGVESSEDGLPVGWRWTTIEQLAKKEKNSIKRGPFGSAVKKGYFVSKGYKIYEQQNVIRNDFRLGSYYIDEERFELLKDFQIFTGDLLITGAGTIGKLAIVPYGIEPGIINQALLKLSLNQDLVDIQFFIHWFETRLRDYLIAQSRGSAMQNISSVKDLKKMEFALPPLYEQQRIVDEVERRLSVAQQVEAVVAASLTRAGRLRQVVLKYAFEGRLG